MHRMIPTRTRIAVLVWLRARERISTRVLATLGFSPLRFSRPVCGSMGVSDGGILHRRMERNCREIRRRVVVASGSRDELNDVGAHVNSSDTAMTTRPMSASEIRQVVIGISPKETCGMIAVCRRRSFGARTLSRRGPRAARDDSAAAGRHVRACRPKYVRLKARTAARSRRPAGALGVAAPMCGRRPIRKIPKQKTRGGFLRAGFAISAMVALCR